MSLEAKFYIKKNEFSLTFDSAFPAQGITALFGASGCGKTSLLRAIAGLDYYPNSFLKMEDKVWQDETIFVPPHQRGLAYVFQEASLFSHLNVQENLAYGYQRVNTIKRKVSIEQAAELLGIEHLLKRKTNNLSGGERQRVAIARAVCVSPKLLLMDEPLTGLDSASKYEILSYIELLQNELKIPIIYVSHVLDEVSHLADHLILLDAGQVIANGTLIEMLTRLDLPLAHDNDVAVVLVAKVASIDEHYHLSYLETPAGRFSVPATNLKVGQNVRLRVAARDVSLTLSAQTNTSILNIFPAVIEEMVSEGQAQVVVKLKISNAIMLARITKKSADLLKLTVGKSVFAQAKSVALFA